MVKAVPFEEDLAGLDVELLDDAVPRRAVLRAAGWGEIRRHRLVGGEQRGVLRGDEELVQVSVEAVARADPRYLPVRVVEDNVLPDAVPGHHGPLPPGEHGPAPVSLHLEVPRGDVLLEPHELTAVVEDHGPMLPDALLQSQKDVAGGGARTFSGDLRRGRGQVRARTEVPDALGLHRRGAWQRPDLRGAQGTGLRGTQRSQIRLGPPRPAAAVRVRKAPAPSALRKRRLENPVPIAKIYTIENAFLHPGSCRIRSSSSLFVVVGSSQKALLQSLPPNERIFVQALYIQVLYFLCG